MVKKFQNKFQQKHKSTFLTCFKFNLEKTFAFHCFGHSPKINQDTLATTQMLALWGQFLHRHSHKNKTWK